MLLSRQLLLDPESLMQNLSDPLRSEVALHRCFSLLMAPSFLSLLVGEWVLWYSGGMVIRGALCDVKLVGSKVVGRHQM